MDNIQDIISKYLNETTGSELWDKDIDKEEFKKMAKELEGKIKAPYVNVSISTLGGKGKYSMMLTFSIDAKEDWSNKILENSRYAKMSLDIDGTLEHFSGKGIGKFRKAKAKSMDDVATKLNKFISDAK